MKSFESAFFGAVGSAAVCFMRVGSSAFLNAAGDFVCFCAFATGGFRVGSFALSTVAVTSDCCRGGSGAAGNVDVGRCSDGCGAVIKNAGGFGGRGICGASDIIDDFDGGRAICCVGVGVGVGVVDNFGSPCRPCCCGAFGGVGAIGGPVFCDSVSIFAVGGGSGAFGAVGSVAVSFMCD